MPTDYCHNPLKLHQKKCVAKRTISKPLFLACKELLPQNTRFCDLCRKTIQKNPDLIYENDDFKVKNPIIDETSSSSTTSSEGKSPVSDVQCEVPLELVYKDLEMTPIKNVRYKVYFNI